MNDRVVPMIHVPDVRATVEWYQSIGFSIVNTYGNEAGGLSFAILSFGDTWIMFNQGGQPSPHFRREVDLYIYTNKVEDIYKRLKDRVEVIEKPHDTFYGMHELIIRDLNRFWLTFGEPSPFQSLLTGVRENNIELVRTTLQNADFKPESLTAALAAASSGNTNSEIAELLNEAGAIPPHNVDAETLRSYVGTYGSEQGFEINVTLKDGQLFAAQDRQQPMSLFAMDSISFRPIEWDEYGTLIFKVEDGKTLGCVVKHMSAETELMRVT
ncbi:MAG TPA: VOC family protein [Pyrinomonadaceae bacterium]|nr:VOC family protein [Pyrinomonadaceae bacterium]